MRQAIPRLTFRRLILAAGGCWVLGMFLFVQRSEVFFSGDAGLKYLVVKQFAAGNFSPVLQPPEPEWVRLAWADGLSPFAPPFTYRTEAGELVVFPFLFQMLTTPFYLLFGLSGLHLAPLLSLFGLWFVFLKTVEELELSVPAGNLGLAALLLASPMSLNGTLFWEHVPACLLLAAALWFLAAARRRQLAKRDAGLLGFAAALALWLRPEAAGFLAPVLCLAAFQAWRQRRPDYACFAGGCLIGIALFPMANLAAFGHPFGAHSFQIVQVVATPAERLRAAAAITRLLWLNLLAYFPLVVPALLGALLIWRQSPGRPAGGWAWLLLVVAAFVLLNAPIFPHAGGKQLGPRYYFPLLPVFCLLLAMGWDACRNHAGGIPWRRGWQALVFVCLLPGMLANVWGGSRTLAMDYAWRVRPLLEELRRHPEMHICVEECSIALELAVLHGERTFWGRHQPSDLLRLAHLLRERGTTQFLFIAGASKAAQEKPYMAARLADGGMLEIKTLPAGRFGDYILFEVAVKYKESGD